VGAVWGTTWHGAFENDAFRRAWLAEVVAAGRSSWTPSPGPGFAEQRERMLDRLADAIDEHLDTGALASLIEHGVPVAGLAAHLIIDPSRPAVASP
ncbi:MAG: hypothetical protein ACRDVZ_13510, partial [Jiangellaceae bacterium]